MKTLGYIISKRNLKEQYPFLEVVNNISLVQNNKPYLIVGLSEAKKIASDNFSILNKKLGDGNYWTFGRTERRDEFEKDIKSFFNDIINSNINNIKYTYINILNINYNIIKRLLNLCYSLEKKYIYIWNDMIYVLCDDKNVIGLSLHLMRYCGYNTEKIIQKIKSNTNNVVCDTEQCISAHIRQRLHNKQYAIPYIISIMDER